jgi:hypothetical protein
MKQLHRITGIIVSVFIVLHLFNHSMAWFGIDVHQRILETFRQVYRIPIIEIIIVACFIFQGISGIKLFWELRTKKEKSKYEKGQMYSGLILGLFLLQHIPATISQRLFYGFDTNFYFASRVVIEEPWLYYFVPYYFAGIVAIGWHIANVHRQKMTSIVGTKTAEIHFYAILSFFVLLSFIILYTFMGGRFDIIMPAEVVNRNVTF